MDEETIRRYIGGFDGVEVEIGSKQGGAPEIAWGDTFFIYDPSHDLPASRRFPFATIVTKDYTGFDEQSDLDRPGVFRLNIGLSKETFERLFVPGGDHDFTALDVLMPHPAYVDYHFACILNPSDATFESLKPLLDEAYGIAVRRAQPRQKS